MTKKYEKKLAICGCVLVVLCIILLLFHPEANASDEVPEHTHTVICPQIKWGSHNTAPCYVDEIPETISKKIPYRATKSVTTDAYSDYLDGRLPTRGDYVKVGKAWVHESNMYKYKKDK